VPLGNRPNGAVEDRVELAEQTDEQLIALAARESSDGPAFGQLVDRHQQRVWRICYRMLGNEHDAADAAQEVFVRLFFQRDRFAGRSRFTTWLHGIAVRTCLTLARTQRRRSRRERVVAQNTATREAGEIRRNQHGTEQADAALDIDAVLATLAPQDRAMMLMKYGEGHTFEELAEMFGMTTSACKMRVTRAKKKLQQHFGDPASP
jgi:RNA polymerase sigma-70 factor (ECF subfamily)